MATPVGRSLAMPYGVTVTEFQRTTTDAVRSLKRYVAQMLGDEWEVRLADEHGTFKTPFAVVMEVGGPQFDGPAMYTDVTQAYAVHCYPDYPDGGTVEQSKMLANETQERLFQGFRIGVGDGYPERIPFFNYGGVALDSPAGSDARREYDYLRMVRGSLNFDRVPDPTDDRWITVVANMRLTWRRAGRQIVGKPVESLAVGFDPA